jgi:ligand-binding sensor domain-containing protein
MKDSYKKILAFGLSAVLSVVVLAQNSQKQMAMVLDKFALSHHYSLEEGLSNNSVSSIAQDDDGFLWFGTSEGLNRFDGTHFTSFFRRADGQGLCFDDIGKLVLLPNHQLLIATWKGLCVMDTRRLTFRQIPLPTRPEYAEGDQIVWDILRGQNGKIWVGTGTGILMLDEKGLVQKSYFAPQQAGKPSYNHFAHELLELPDGTVAVKCLIETGIQGWQVVDFERNMMKPLAHVFPFCGVLDSAKEFNNVWVQRDKKQVVYTTWGSQSNTALMCLDWTTQTTRPLLTNKQPAKTREQGQFNRPFPLFDSFFLLQPFLGKLTVYDHQKGAIFDLEQWQTSLQNHKDIVNFTDRDGNLWLCPYSEGIYFLPLKTPSVKMLSTVNVVHEKAMADQFVSKEWFRFFCFNYQNVQLFTSPNGGFYSLDKATSAVTAVKDAQNKELSSAYEVIPFHADTVWVITRGGLIWHKTTNNTHGWLKDIATDLTKLHNEFLYRDSHGLIWASIKNNGAAYFDTQTRQLHHFPSQGNNPPFPIPSITQAVEDAEGNMWFCHRMGPTYFVKWTRQTGVFEKVRPLSKLGKNCTGARIFLADKRGNLWVKTTEEGAFCINIHTLEAQNINKSDGLSTNNPNGMCVDKLGDVWFATPMGLSRYNPDHKFIRTFYKRDGLPSNTITNVSLLDTAQNILLVSTNKGLCLFDPAKVATTEPNPTSYITSVAVSTDSSFAPPESGFLELPYRKNDLSFEFTSINFYDGTRNLYQYRLDGADEQWRNVEATNTAIYLNLPSGNYTFRVRTANSDGVWSEKEAILSIKIFPPFWRTWTFQLLFLAALGSLAWWLYQRQIRLVQEHETEKNKVRQQLADLEMKALRAQMNPHFVFNALNSVQNFILKNDPREASRYLTKFARLMRLILENSESPVVPLAKEIELLKYYTELEVLRFSKQFEVVFQIDPAFNTESMAIPGMLIQPHIENAIWHGLMHKKDEAGQLIIRFQKEGDKTVVCEIEDNGVGRVAAALIEQNRPKSHRSTGLSNIRNRLELLNAQLAEDIRLDIEDLYDADGQAKGTKAVVRMPIILR